MKNKICKFIVMCLSLFSICYILFNNKLINENIIYAINLWITKVFPSLFPMFIINDLLINTGFPIIIANLFKNLKINSYVIYIFIMSIFSGTPTNAIICKKLVENNSITSNDASLILAFTFFNNPIFLFNMLSSSFKTAITLKIILINYITNVFIFLFFYKKLTFSNNQLKQNNISINQAISLSIKKSIDTLLIILGTITFYIIISTILLNCFDFNPLTTSIIKGVLEITQGLNYLPTLNISHNIKEIIAITIISFGGLSIHSQINNIISETNIKYKYFFLGRLFHVIISVILLCIYNIWI